MEVDADDFRRAFEALNDDALLAVKRDELVDVARQCYDAEMARRGLTARLEAREEAPPPIPMPEGAADPDAMVTVAIFTYPDEAKLSRGLLEAADIPCFLRDEQTLAMDWFWTNALGGLRLTVPAAYADQAREVLASRISDEELAAQAEAARPRL